MLPFIQPPVYPSSIICSAIHLFIPLFFQPTTYPLIICLSNFHLSIYPPTHLSIICPSAPFPPSHHPLVHPSPVHHLSIIYSSLPPSTHHHLFNISLFYFFTSPKINLSIHQSIHPSTHMYIHPSSTHTSIHSFLARAVGRVGYELCLKSESWS